MSEKESSFTEQAQSQDVRCIVCNGPADFWLKGEDRTYVATNYVATLFRCRKCGAAFQHPMPSREVIASFYPGGYWLESLKTSPLAKLMRFYVAMMLKWDLFRWFQRMKLAPRNRFLDLGCSRGDFLAMAAKTGVHAEGIEGDLQAADFARKTYGVTVSSLDLDTWEPIDEAWDGLSLFHVLEHVRDPHKLLLQCWKGLKPGGRLLLRVPNVSSWQARLFGAKWKPLDLPRHLTHFHPKVLRELLQNTGFSVAVQSTWTLRDGPPAWAATVFQSGEPTFQQIKRKRSTWRVGVFFLLTWFFTPLELMAAAFGQGGMITFVGQKLPNHKPITTRGRAETATCATPQ